MGECTSNKSVKYNRYAALRKNTLSDVSVTQYFYAGNSQYTGNDGSSEKPLLVPDHISWSCKVGNNLLPTLSKCN